MENQEQLREEALKYAQTNLENWELPKKSQEEQVEFLNKYIGEQIVTNWQYKDPITKLAAPQHPVEIIVLEDLVQSTQIALQDLSLPDNANIEQLTREEAENRFKIFARENLQVRGAKLTAMIVPPQFTPKPTEQFIWIVTVEKQKAQHLQRWDNEFGYSKSIADQGWPMIPDEKMLEQVWHFWWLLTRISIDAANASQEEGVKAATAAAPVMFGG